MMTEQETVKNMIREAFAGVEYPGDWCLRGSNEGDEPYLLEKEFKGKTDWRTLEPAFIDQAPDGFGSALSFFSDEAFHFYLPAYLIADIDDALEYHNPVFTLTHGLVDLSKIELVNPRRYGQRTWFDEARHKFSVFSQQEAMAILAYLHLMRERNKYDRNDIEQALRNFWIERVEELK